MPITCILFDLDNTLTHRRDAIQRFARRFYLDFYDALHADTRFRAVASVIQHGDGGGYRPKEEMFAEIIRDLRWLTTPDVTTISSYWYRISPKCMQPRPGVIATLTTLRQCGYRLGIISNGQTYVQNATIDAIAVRPYMQTVIISEAVNLRKPDARIFHLALAQLQATPEQTLYVGDHPISDIQGAQAAGLKSVWLCDAPDVSVQPDYTIRQIPELLDLLSVMD